MSDRLEGRSRPGHFRGVTTVVLKLFEIVQPRFAFFGRKDAQQVRIIRQMARDLDLDTEIVVCPIVREPDGLALSSRNAYFPRATAARRRCSIVRSSAQSAAKSRQANATWCDLLASVRSVIEAEPGVSLDYAEIVDADTLEPVMTLAEACYVLLAARVGSTRLIDNALIEPAGDSFNVTI